MFFYPLYTGHFIYEPGYALHREAYDSFLLLYIQSGSLLTEFEGRKTMALEGSFVLLDCYRPHSYRSDAGCDALWCHFDGITARSFYTAVVSRLGNVFSLSNPQPAVSRLTELYQAFATSGVIREALLSKYLNDILTACLLDSPCPGQADAHAGMTEEITAYISEHFSEELSVSALARSAGLSQYYFIRTFKKETGFTPHEYLINIRINTAKYLLKNSRLSVKEICFHTGFSCEAVFCSAFKKRIGMTPTHYREQEEQEP